MVFLVIFPYIKIYTNNKTKYIEAPFMERNSKFQLLTKKLSDKQFNFARHYTGTIGTAKLLKVSSLSLYLNFVSR